MVNVIKVYLQRPNSKRNEIRRLAVSSDILSRFESLCVKVIELFPLLCGRTFDLSWEDSEGDLILMSSDAELAQALANANDGLIKIYVSLSEEKPISSPGSDDNTDQSPAGGSIHPGVICNGCNSMLHGSRYKCLQCKDYDLCSTCNAAKKHSHHDMLKLVEPVFVLRKWVGDHHARRMWKALFGNRGGAHPSCSPEAEEKPGCSFKLGSPTVPKFEEFLAQAANSSPSQPLFPEAFGNLLKAAGVELKSAFFPSAPCGGPFTHNFSQTEKAAKESQQDSSKEDKKEAKSSDAETSPATSSGLQTEVKTEIPVNQGASSAVNEAVEKAAPEVKHEEKEQSPEGDALSNTADGWTLLNKDDASKKTPECEPSAPVEKVRVVKVERQEENHSDDPKIANALLKMHAMGFTNEGGWLERLLVTKQGNINEALDALYPNTQRH